MTHETLLFLTKLAQQGDVDASRRLHQWIEERLRNDVAKGCPAPDGLIELLIKMHGEIGLGADPIDAMLLCRPPNRPREILQGRRLFFEVERERALWKACRTDELRKQVGAREYKSDSEIFKALAPRFGYKNWRSLKNRYNEERNRSEDLWAL